MAKATVRPDLDEAADVARNFAAKVALDLVLAVKNLAQPTNLGFAKVLHLLTRIKSRLLDDLGGVVLADAVNERKGVENRLLTREVDACDTCHTFLLNLLVSPVAACASR